MINNLTGAIINETSGGGGNNSQGRSSQRIVYPGVVVNATDPSEQGRITVRLTEIDENGKFFGGKDKEKKDDNLVICESLMPRYFYAMPAEGEMVYVILQNPYESNATRYWIGPIITSNQKLKTQPYTESIKVNDITDFYSNKKTDNKVSAKLFPKPSEIALQGKEDADLILKKREAVLSAGKFNLFEGGGEINFNSENLLNPSRVQLKQYLKKDIPIQAPLTDDDPDLLPKFSLGNITSTNVNIFSLDGAWRDPDEMSQFESNKFLKTFGDIKLTDGEIDTRTPNHLHPVVFGDELVKLLDLMIRVLLNHIHTPQKPLVPNPDSNELSKYKLPTGLLFEQENANSEIFKLLSNHIRVN